MLLILSTFVIFAEKVRYGLKFTFQEKITHVNLIFCRLTILSFTKRITSYCRCEQFIVGVRNAPSPISYCLMSKTGALCERPYSVSVWFIILMFVWFSGLKSKPGLTNVPLIQHFFGRRQSFKFDKLITEHRIKNIFNEKLIIKRHCYDAFEKAHFLLIKWK